MRKCAILFLASVAIAQTPVSAHRDPPPQTDLKEAQREADAALAAMHSQTDPLPVPDAPAQATASRPQKAPPGYKRTTDVALDPIAKQALAEANTYRVLDGAGPVDGKDGRVIYPYGGGAVELVCAPFRLCTVELEPGEILSKAPSIGDPIRWDVKEQAFGTGNTVQNLVVLRPHRAGLDTDLVIATNKRAYFLRVISKPTDYINRVAFSYPDDSQKEWQNFQVQMAALTKPIDAKADCGKSDQPLPPPDTNPCHGPKANHGYRFKSKHFATFLPEEACDNGTFVFLRLPELVTKTSGPVAMQRAGHHLEPLNYDVQGSTYVIHQLVDQVALVEGTGKRRQVVEVLSPRTTKK